jgi:hypothetical protein
VQTQLDRLTGRIGINTVDLGVIQFTTSVKIAPADGLWRLDDCLVVAEDWHAEMWLDNAENITLCSKVWRPSVGRPCMRPVPTTSATRPAAR